METSLPTTHSAPESAWTIANVVYGLHTLAIVVGVIGTATVIGSFLWSIPSILAVILNYANAARRTAPGSNRTTAGRSARSGSRRSGCSARWILIVTIIGIPIAW